jgi:hypothetical protein
MPANLPGDATPAKKTGAVTRTSNDALANLESVKEIRAFLNERQPDSNSSRVTTLANTSPVERPAALNEGMSSLANGGDETTQELRAFLSQSSRARGASTTVAATPAGTALGAVAVK